MILKCCPEQLLGQHVESNLLKATCCLWQLSSNFLARSCFQHVESNLLPKSCHGQHVAFNMLKATCCQKVAQKLPQATSCFQQVAFNMLTKSCSKVATGNKLLSTSCFQHVARKVALGNILETFFSNKVLRNLIDRFAQAIIFNVSQQAPSTYTTTYYIYRIHTYTYIHTCICA